MLKFLVISVFALVLLTACTEYNKIMKSSDNEKKCEAALMYYEKKDYIKAVTILEEIIPFYKIDPRGENLYFTYCMANYELGDYYLSGYYFKKFVRQYPTSKHCEEALFLCAMCSVRNSPMYSLDQTETLNALDEIQIFIDIYPNSSRVDSCNKIMDDLRTKLELKQFEYAMMYYQTQHYKAAGVAFEATLEKFPETSHKEDILYYLVKSNFELAMNSIPAKKKERLDNTLKSYRRFVAEFPESKRLEEVESLKKRVEKSLELVGTEQF